MLRPQIGFISAPVVRMCASSAAGNSSPSRGMATVSPARRLRELSAGTRRGSAAPPETLSALYELVDSLEAKGWAGPGEGPLASEAGLAKLNGPWELVFEVPKDNQGAERPGTAQRVSIAATDGIEGRRGKVLQNIDVNAKRIENRAETGWGTFRVEATFAPLGESTTEVEVVFDTARFKLGPLPEVGFPISWIGGRGTLDTTYLGDDVRIGRGNKGTLFCLVRPDSGSN